MPKPVRTLMDCFEEIPDPRNDKNKQHKLIDILIIAICAVIGGCEGWEHMEEFATSKEEWFRSFLELPSGIPSYSTIRRVFVLLDSKKFEKSFLEWVGQIREVLGGDIIPIDGKTLRRSHDRSKGNRAIHIVSAWSQKNSLVLGQIKTEEKSNEITAIPELLEMLNYKGCIVTIDAMGCQTEIAKKIVRGEGDYVLALKGNQGTLHEDVSLYFQELEENGFQESSRDYYEETDQGHGRLEIRRYWTVSDIGWLQERHPTWEKLSLIGKVESERHLGDKITKENRYYIASIENQASKFALAVRGHWGIENPLHWCLDFTFREDESRIRSGNSAENFAVLRHLALNLLKNEKTSKKSVRLKRMRAGWDNKYLEKVLTG